LSSVTLSVVIPTYNRSASLAVTLAGLGRQTYPANQFEVIIVSDGSTDNTENVVAAYQMVVKNSVRFIGQSNAGPSVARNRGITESAHDVVVFLDDDVEPVPEFLQNHAIWHESDPLRSVIGPMSPDPARQNLEPIWIIWEHEKLQRLYRMFKTGGAYAGKPAGPEHFYSGNVSVRREWLLQANGFDTRFTRQEDVELASRLAQSYGIHFLFDFSADGVHRPVRTFESWLRIPCEYGRLDAQRLTEGTITEESIAHNLSNRHWLTGAVIDLTRRSPLAARLIVRGLSAAALVSSKHHWRRLGLLVLSGLYNAAYVQNFYAARRVLATNIEKASSRDHPAPDRAIRR
jgi:glycosyltransferase involved in cell wall biosynthesis